MELNDLTDEQKHELFKQLSADKSVNSRKVTKVQISEKTGCICFYGLRKMPISIYPEELDAIMQSDVQAAIRKLLADDTRGVKLDV